MWDGVGSVESRKRSLRGGWVNGSDKEKGAGALSSLGARVAVSVSGGAAIDKIPDTKRRRRSVPWDEEAMQSNHSKSAGVVPMAVGEGRSA
jgi:hypothetical protein